MAVYKGKPNYWSKLLMDKRKDLLKQSKNLRQGAVTVASRTAKLIKEAKKLKDKPAS